MLISFFRKKISSVNSQLQIKINFEIIFRNLEHVLFFKFSDRNFTYGALWLVNRPVFTNTKWSVGDVVYIWLLKVYFQCESVHFWKKIEIFILK